MRRAEYFEPIYKDSDVQRLYRCCQRCHEVSVGEQQYRMVNVR